MLNVHVLLANYQCLASISLIKSSNAVAVLTPSLLAEHQDVADVQRWLAGLQV